MTKISHFLMAAMAAALMACSPAVVSAATISWGSGTSFTGDSDVSTSGVKVFAINGGGSAPVTINGVEFQDTAGSGTSAGGYTIGDFYTKLGNANAEGTFDPNGTPSGGAGTGPYDALSSDYQGFVSSALWAGNPDSALPAETDTVTMSNLTVGHDYQIQFWTYDGRNGRSGFYAELDGDASNPVLLNDDAGSNGADGIGQYVIGTFTADATTQSYSHQGFLTNGDVNQGRIQINAIQLRNLTIPEPTSMALLAVGCLAILGGRRKV